MKWVSLTILVFFLACPKASAFAIITPSTAAVQIGGTLQFTSTDTVTWSLASGSKGSISGSGLYTAPTAYFSPHQILNGCQILPEDSIFNTDISGLPVSTNSVTRMNNLFTVLTSSIGISWDINMPRNVYSNATPLQTLTCRFTSEQSGTYPMYGFPDRAEEQTNLPDDYFTQDHHILGISTTSVNGQPMCRIYEQYQYYPAGADAGHPLNTNDACVAYDAMSYNLFDVSVSAGGGVDAAGAPILPLTIKYQELLAGQINHALRFTLDPGNICSAFIWPAVAEAPRDPDCSKNFPYGSRLRLKSSYIINPSLSPQAKAVQTALKKYGMIMVDGGQAGHITAEATATADTTTFNALWSELATSSITIGTDMEQVDESALQVSTWSQRVALTSGFVTPPNYVEVIATKVADSSTSSVRVALLTATAGTYNPSFQGNNDTLTVMAGTPQFQIPAYVNGSTDTVATCTMGPNSLGTLTSDCKYTAPATQFNDVFYTTVTISPRISSLGKIQFPLVVMSSAGIFERFGGVSGSDSQPPFDASWNFVDANGFKYFLEPIGNYPNFDVHDTQGSASWPTQIYNGLDYGSGDKFWSAMVPNGNYTLTGNFGFGPGNASSLSVSSNTLETNGTIFVSSSTASLAYTVNTAQTYSTNLTVRDNRWHWAIRGSNASSADFISAFSLAFVSPLSNPTGSTLKGTTKFKGAHTLK